MAGTALVDSCAVTTGSLTEGGKSERRYFVECINCWGENKINFKIQIPESISDSLNCSRLQAKNMKLV